MTQKQGSRFQTALLKNGLMIEKSCLKIAERTKWLGKGTNFKLDWQINESNTKHQNKKLYILVNQ